MSGATEAKDVQQNLSGTGSVQLRSKETGRVPPAFTNVWALFWDIRQRRIGGTGACVPEPGFSGPQILSHKPFFFCFSSVQNKECFDTTHLYFNVFISEGDLGAGARSTH